MNAETLIRAAEHDGLRLALTVAGKVKCVGPKLIAERWAPQLRQFKVEIAAALTAANDSEPFERQLSDGAKSSLAIAERAIAQAALTDQQKASRLADLRRDPAIARFWAMAWPEASEVIALAPPAAQTTGRCVECVSFQLAGMGHRCSHADRVLPNEPPIVECLADNQCHRFVHWHPAQSKDSTS